MTLTVRELIDLLRNYNPNEKVFAVDGAVMRGIVEVSDAQSETYGAAVVLELED